MPLMTGSDVETTFHRSNTLRLCTARRRSPLPPIHLPIDASMTHWIVRELVRCWEQCGARRLQLWEGYQGAQGGREGGEGRGRRGGTKGRDGERAHTTGMRLSAVMTILRSMETTLRFLTNPSSSSSSCATNCWIRGHTARMQRFINGVTAFAATTPYGCKSNGERERARARASSQAEGSR